MTKSETEALAALTSCWADFMPKGYEHFIRQFKRDWARFAQLRRADAERYALAPFMKTGARVVVDPTDPRWQAFCQVDFAAIRDHFAGHRVTDSQLLHWINFVRQVNGIAEPVASLEDNRDDEAVPEPSVPQHFQGDLAKAKVIVIGMNPGLDRQVAGYAPEQQAHTLETRAAVLAGLRTAAGPFASLLVEMQLPKALAKPSNQYYLSHYAPLTTALNMPVASLPELVADGELVAYQTAHFAAVPRGLETWLPTSQAMLAVLDAMIAAGGRLFVLRHYTPTVFRLGRDNDATFLANSFQGVTGSLTLSATNLVSGREKQIINGLRRQKRVATASRKDEIEATLAAHRRIQKAGEGDFGAALAMITNG